MLVDSSTRRLDVGGFELQVVHLDLKAAHDNLEPEAVRSVFIRPMPVP